MKYIIQMYKYEAYSFYSRVWFIVLEINASKARKTQIILTNLCKAYTLHIMKISAI